MNTHFNHSEMPKFMNGFSQQMRFSMAMNQRIIMLYDDVDDNSMMESIYYLNKLKYMDEKFCDDKKPIEIQINTCGGAVEDGLSLLSLIENMKSDGYHIITTNIGRGYSMGFFLSICGTERRAYRYAKYMYHDVSYGVYGKHGNILEQVEFTEKIQKDMISIATKYTNLSEDFFLDINARKADKYFTAEDMLGIKGVDTIVF